MSSLLIKTLTTPATTAPDGAVSQLVLDTNVVLDWLLFADPTLDALTTTISAKRLRLITHQPALDELQRVLGYDVFKLDAARRKMIFDRYRRHVHDGALPLEFALTNLLLPANFPVCKDPDDQHFLALCYHCRADALVTRDKALLSLRKRARKFGTTIMDIRQLPDFLAEI